MKRSQEQISNNMSKIRGKDSRIEIKLRKRLWKDGYRFRKNSSTIYGKPDISIKKYKIAIFCDSEFWHGLNWSVTKESIKSNREFWIAKIERNIERDVEVNDFLRGNGWIVLRFSGKDILNNLESCISEIEGAINERKTKTKID
jgi:DNA mismatch endonuclease (patch repair protein)